MTACATSPIPHPRVPPAPGLAGGGGCCTGGGPPHGRVPAARPPPVSGSRAARRRRRGPAPQPSPSRPRTRSLWTPWLPQPPPRRCCTVPRRRPASCCRGPGPNSSWSPPATTGSPPPAATVVLTADPFGGWLPDGFWFSTGSLARHNLAANPQITVHLESGDQVVILEGVAAAVAGAGRLQGFLAAYNPKYDWDAVATDEGGDRLGGGWRARLAGAAAGRLRLGRRHARADPLVQGLAIIGVAKRCRRRRRRSPPGRRPGGWWRRRWRPRRGCRIRGRPGRRGRPGCRRR
jgi:hypothetical protein